MGTATLLIATLAIPISEQVDVSTPSPTAPQATPFSDSPSREALPPITAKLDYGAPECEPLVLASNQTSDLPSYEDFAAPWAYSHGGSTYVAGVYELVIEGKSEKATVIRDMHISGLGFEPLPEHAVAVTKCPLGEGGAISVRHFEVDLSKETPTFESLAGEPTSEGGDSKAVEFPYKVSSTDPEVFEIYVWGDCSCVADYQISLDWTSGDDAGVMLVDRKFSRLRSAIGSSTEDPISWRRMNKDGTLSTR